MKKRPIISRGYWKDIKIIINKRKNYISNDNFGGSDFKCNVNGKTKIQDENVTDTKLNLTIIT